MEFTVFISWLAHYDVPLEVSFIRQRKKHVVFRLSGKGVLGERVKHLSQCSEIYKWSTN